MSKSRSLKIRIDSASPDYFTKKDTQHHGDERRDEITPLDGRFSFSDLNRGQNQQHPYKMSYNKPRFTRGARASLPNIKAGIRLFLVLVSSFKKPFYFDLIFVSLRNAVVNCN